jgi:hypothetical protein
MYNLEIKERFINELYYDEETKRTVKHAFEKFSISEEHFSRDLYEFNQVQLVDVLRLMNCPTVNALGKNFGYMKQYVKWATENGYCPPNMAFMNVFRKDLQNYISIDAVSNQYIKDRPELYLLCDKIYNPVDRAILVLLYEGVNGNEMEELRFLEKQDIKFISNSIEIRNGSNPRVISHVDERSMQILQEAIEQEIYYNGNGETEAKAPTRKLMNSSFVVRQINLKKSLGEAMTIAGINVKLKNIKQWTGKYYFNSTNGFYSGIFEKLSNIELGRELVRQDYQTVLSMSGMNPETWGLLKENYLVFKTYK